MSGVLIVAEQRRGELRPVSLELIGAAQTLRRGADPVAVAVLGTAPGQLAAGLKLAGVDEIIDDQGRRRGIRSRHLRGGRHRAHRRPRGRKSCWSHIAWIPSATRRALAARLGLGFASDVFKVERIDGELVATRGGYGQKVNVEVDFPGRSTVLLALRANVFKPPANPGAPRVTEFAAPPVTSRSKGLEFIELAASDDVDMTQAEFILTIGRGIGEEAKVAQFRELADAIGATLGCSRPIADAGWLPKSRQVGQSGKTASACKLYIAMGVSGAIQHLAGMKHVATIVAVNSDAGASIFGVAKYGIVGDIFEIAEELRRRF